MASLELLVLGGGGPFVQSKRASLGYVVLFDGKPRLLIDCGDGIFTRLGETGVDPAELDAILLTHTHAGHTGDLPVVVFATLMAGGGTPLMLVGLVSREQHPAASGSPSRSSAGRGLELSAHIRRFRRRRARAAERSLRPGGDCGARPRMSGLAVTSLSRNFPVAKWPHPTGLSEVRYGYIERMGIASTVSG